MDDQHLIKHLGNVIRKLRKAQNLSQEEFAYRCALHRTYVGAIERGEKTMTIVTAAKLAAALGLSLSQLFVELEKEAAESDG